MAMVVNSVHSFDTHFYYIRNGTIGHEKKSPIGFLRLLQRGAGCIRGRSYDKAKILASLFTVNVNNPAYTPVLGKVLCSIIGDKKVTKKIESLINSLFHPQSAESIGDLALQNRIVPFLFKLKEKLPKGSELAKRVELVQEKVSVYKAWKESGRDLSLFKTDYESVRFLVKERLLYTIEGLERTSNLGKRRKQLIVRDGKLYALLEGKRIPVHSLIDKLRFDKDYLQLVEKTTGKPWLYLLPEGLQQIDRCSSEKLLPITRLDVNEMRRLRAHACKMEGTGFSKQMPPTCVYQLFTNPRKIGKVPQSRLLDGLQALAPVHVGFRIIDQDGYVYSSGFASTLEEDKYCDGAFNMLATISGMPGTVDYEEFRPNEGRIVTSIPMTKETSDKMLDTLNEMREKKIRFSLLKQNCSCLAVYLARIAGVKIHQKVSRGEVFTNLLPHYSSYPRLNSIVSKIIMLSEKTSKKTRLPSVREMNYVVGKVFRAIKTPLRIISNIITNLILVVFGATRGSPLTGDEYVKPGKRGVRRFFSIIQSPWDIISDAPTTVLHSGPVIDWQLQQKSTCRYVYKSPSMNVLPTNSSKSGDWHRRYGRFRTVNDKTPRRIKSVGRRVRGMRRDVLSRLPI